jgi:hypothetical protein
VDTILPRKIGPINVDRLADNNDSPMPQIEAGKIGQHGQGISTRTDDVENSGETKTLRFSVYPWVYPQQKRELLNHLLKRL